MSTLVDVNRRTFLRPALTGGGVLALFPGGFSATPFGQPFATASRLTEGAPSATAQGAAVWRALHQIIDYPRVLDDPLAVPIIGREGARALQFAADRQANALRAFIALRSRYAEDRLAAAVGRGGRQARVPGAGPDTLSFTIPY